MGRIALPKLGELVGKKCQIVFSLPSDQWPIRRQIQGLPATAKVEGVDNGMVKLEGMWVSISSILTIRPC